MTQHQHQNRHRQDVTALNLNIIYAIDSSKIRNLGWKPFITLENGVKDLAYWYKNNIDWLKSNKNKNQEWLDQQYGK